MGAEAHVLATNEEDARCPSCNQALLGDYCHRCGERRVEDHDFSLIHFIGHSLHDFTHLEFTKIPRTIWTLLTRPGFLTNAFLSGQRRRFLTPVGLAVILLPLSLFLYSHFKQAAVYDVSFFLQVDAAGKGELNAKLQRAAEKRQVPREVLIERINQRYQKYMSRAQVAAVVVLSLALWLMYLRRRRYLVEHVVFALHYTSFICVVNVLVWPVVMQLGLQHPVMKAVNVVTMLGWVVYLVVAMKRVYRQSTGWTVAKAVPLVAGYFGASMVLMIGALVAGIVTALKG
ncbi:MAG TPA: DUF3667 domain-containing protein [Polyangia bacterium]|nr:DUF3667 domain-containing protein [Polyangia bacterium]